jgi:opacity protein-like surface antigen
MVVMLVLASLAAPASAATVLMKDGGRLEGAVVSSTADRVVLDTAQGRVSIDRAAIQSIDYAGVESAAPAAPASPVPAPPPSAAVRVPERRSFPLELPFDDRRQLFSVAFGLNDPLTRLSLQGTAGGGSAQGGDVGAAFGFQYLYSPTPRLAWGAEFDYADRGTTFSSDLLPRADSRVTGASLLLLGELKYSLAVRGPVRPYILLGAGAHRTSTTVDARPSDGFVWADSQSSEGRRLVDDSAVGAAATVRLGLDFGLFDPTTFGLEAGWTGLSSASYQATAAGRALGITGVKGPLSLFSFTARWGWGF